MKHCLIVFAMSMFFVWSGMAEACHDHGKKCQVEEWRSIHNKTLEHLIVEGMTTCDMSHVAVRVYDTSGEEPKFIGTGSTMMMGHTFRVRVRDFPQEPASMSIKFDIEPGLGMDLLR